jgi:signal peptidase II
MEAHTHSKYLIVTLVSLTILLLDQATKYLIIHTLPLHHSFPIVKHFVTILHTRNKGIAFGLLAGQGGELRSTMLIITSFLAIAFIFYLLKNLKSAQRYATITLSLILGGAIGNLIDRVRWGEVIDFIDLHWYHYHWPAFNVADAAISTGLVLLFIGIVTNQFPSK